MKKLKVNTYAVLKECIEIGINGGWNKAHKHTDDPSEEYIKDQILHYIMLQVCEKFKFDD
jgi:pyruvate-formate lyase